MVDSHRSGGILDIFISASTDANTGNIEALAVAYGNAEMIVDANPDLVICTWEFDVKAEYSANVIMMQKGETELLDAVNAILAQAKEEFAAEHRPDAEN